MSEIKSKPEIIEQPHVEQILRIIELQLELIKQLGNPILFIPIDIEGKKK